MWRISKTREEKVAEAVAAITAGEEYERRGMSDEHAKLVVNSYTVTVIDKNHSGRVHTKHAFFTDAQGVIWSACMWRTGTLDPF
jgi:hypothetical protein